MSAGRMDSFFAAISDCGCLMVTEWMYYPQGKMERPFPNERYEISQGFRIRATNLALKMPALFFLPFFEVIPGRTQN